MRLPSRALVWRQALSPAATVVGLSLAAGAAAFGGVGRTGAPAGDVPEGPSPVPAAASPADSARSAPPLQAAASPADSARSAPPPGRAFYWTRAIYTGSRRSWWGWEGRGAWATDFPKGDRQFLVVLKRLVRLDAYDYENAVSLADPRLRRFPLVYAVEVGHMDLTQEEVRGLRSYLQAGGMLIVDDFWGSWEWARFEENMRRVLPGRPILELSTDHPVFSAYYRIDEIKQVPARGRGIRGRPTWEQDGYTPHVRAIFDDEGRIMVLINWNTDLGDAWEWAEDPLYPLEYSTYAYEIGANMIVYGMSH